MHLTIGDNTGTVGDRTPALWIHKTRGVYIATALNGVASVAKFFKTKKPVLNEWTRVEISQVKNGRKYLFSVAIKGETLWSEENTRPKEFTDVMVFASSNWYAAQDGSIRHFEIENKVPGNDKRWHSHLNTSNLTHISVLMQDLSSWSAWSVCTKNRTQSTMACSISPESEDCQTFMERQDCVLTGEIFAKDCLLTLVKSRLALGSPGCSFVCDHAKNGPIHRKMVVACPLVITSKVKFFFRPNKTRKGE